MISKAIEASVRHPLRLHEDLARDASSKPAEVMAFIGIVPGMTVLDLNAGAGYWSEMLSRVVGEKGRIIAHNHPDALHILKPEVFERRYGRGRLPNVVQVLARHHELELPAESLDAILMSMIYHDTYWFAPGVDWGPVDQQSLLADLRDALRPGGVVVVIDHCAELGSDPRESAITTHRIDPAIVRRDFRAAGFVLDDESHLLGNAADDHSLGVFDESVSGRTDRFLMRFQR